jgi:nitrogen fixation protein FixH
MKVAAVRELKGWHVGAMMVGFFAVVIGVNATFITLAAQTFPGEIVKKSYVQGLHYNQTIAARKAQAAMGWQAEAAFERTAASPIVRVRMIDSTQAGLSALTLSGALKRTVTAGQDHALTFIPRGGGVYEAPLPADLGRGRWLLTARAEGGAVPFDLTAELTWR